MTLVKRSMKHSINSIPEHCFITTKIHTTIGSIILTTLYVPPREQPHVDLTLPTIETYNLSVFFLRDLNASNPFSGHFHSRNKVKTLFTTIKRQNAKYIDLHFNTFHTNTREGKHNIILRNRKATRFITLTRHGEYSLSASMSVQPLSQY